MSKPVKEMMMADYLAKLGENGDALLVNIRGFDANTTNNLRKDLAKSEISLTVLRNNVARKAFEGTGLEPLGELLTGPNALVYGAETVVEVVMLTTAGLTMSARSAKDVGRFCASAGSVCAMTSATPRISAQSA